MTLSHDRQCGQEVANLRTFEIIPKIETGDTTPFKMTRNSCQRTMRSGQYRVVTKAPSLCHSMQNLLGDTFGFCIRGGSDVERTLSGVFSSFCFQLWWILAIASWHLLSKSFEHSDQPST